MTSVISSVSMVNIFLNTSSLNGILLISKDLFNPLSKRRNVIKLAKHGTDKNLYGSLE